MGLRETINEKKGLTTAIAVGIVVVAIALIAYQFTGSTSPASEDEFQNYFTTDDGKSYFVASASNVPPYQHEGKEAVRAFVYTCDDGKTTFVGYLMRFTPEWAAKVKAAQNTPTYEETLDKATAEAELKKPGDAQWTSRKSPDAAKVVKPNCPSGGGELKLVG